MSTASAERTAVAETPWHLLDLLDLVKHALCVDTATLLLLDRAEQVLDCVAAVGNDEAMRRPFRVPVGHGFAGRVAADLLPVALDQVDATTVLNPAILHAGVRSLLGVPVLRDGRLLGVLHVGTRAIRTFSADDRRFLLRAADRIGESVRAQAGENALAARLQRLLVPSRPAGVPGLDLASRYVPAEGHLGGDWYDVFQLPGGRTGLVMGDVAGHGLASAVVMSRVRSALRAYALEHEDPARVLDLLDDKVATFEPEALATVLYAVTRPPFATLDLASAGHLAPLLADGHGVREIAVPSGPPIGMGWPGLRRTLRMPWPVGAALCFYTDGLIERRHGTDQLAAGLDTLLAAFGPDTPETVCDRILAAELGENRRIEDDITLLIARRAA